MDLQTLVSSSAKLPYPVMKKPLNIVITGASGYAGFTAAVALREAGHQVTALLRHPEAARARQLREQEVRTQAADLRQPATYRDALAACDVFISTVMDHADPIGTDQILFDTLQNLPPAAGTKRLFIYTTGCSIYGKVPERLMDETTPGNPDHYLYFRMEMEQQALKLDSVRTVVLRPGFMFGKDGQSCAATEWFAAAEQGDVIYRGDPEKGWSWIHVADLAQAYRAVVEHPEPLDQEIFCLADDEQPTCLAIAQACARVAGFAGEVPLGPPQEGNWGSTVFDQNEFITSAKARGLLGWEPRQPGLLADLNLYYQSWKSAQLAS